jgi:hypothetical protein
MWPEQPGPELTATVSGGTISITSGTTAGNMTWNLSRITADNVEFSAPAGFITGSSALITSDLLTANAATGFTAQIAGGAVRANLTGTGSINLISSGPVELRQLKTSDGGIQVQSIGDMQALDLEAGGSSDSSDINLQTFPVAGQSPT